MVVGKAGHGDAQSPPAQASAAGTATWSHRRLYTSAAMLTFLPQRVCRLSLPLRRQHAADVAPSAISSTAGRWEKSDGSDWG